LTVLKSPSLVQHQIFSRIAEISPQLTPKNRVLADYVVRNYQKVVFMTARSLAEACQVSEATVIRFVTKLGFSGYGEFIRLFRDLINTRLTLSDRIQLQELEKAGEETLHKKVVLSELANMHELHDNLDEQSFAQMVRLLSDSPTLDVVGARLSHSLAYYLAWALQRIRPGVRLLQATQETALDQLMLTKPPGLLVAVGVARYSRALIDFVRYAKKLNFKVVAITDNLISPLINLAELSLIAPSRHFALIGNLAALMCLLNCLVVEVAHLDVKRTKAHQERLEDFYREQDIFFDLEMDPVINDVSDDS